MSLDVLRTPVGSSDLEIAALMLGGNVFGWTADRETSFEVLDAFVGGGGDAVDTADGYSHWVPGNSGGESETVIGEWFAARGSRDRVTLATKVSTHPEFAGLAADNVRAAVEASLRRLQTDRIDLYYAHFDDPKAPLDETVAAFSQLVDDGKIRAIGISNYSAERIAEWFRIAREGGYHLPVALQPHYNLVERDYEENGLRDEAVREQLAVFPYFSLAKGFLAGKYRDESDTTAEGASPRAGQVSEYLTPKGRTLLSTLDRIAAEYDVPVATISLAWLRQQQSIAAPIASARNTEQLQALLRSLTLTLSDSDLLQLSVASQ